MCKQNSLQRIYNITTLVLYKEIKENYIKLLFTLCNEFKLYKKAALVLHHVYKEFPLFILMLLLS
jgi:hypothetical protein